MRSLVVLLILQWGAMSSSAADEISVLFGILLLSAPAYTLAVLFNNIAFSMGDTKFPAIAQLLSTLLIVLLVPYAAQEAGATGAVLTFSAIAWVEAVSLLIFQAWQYHIVHLPAVVRSFGLVGLLALSVGVVSYAMLEVLPQLAVASKPFVAIELVVVSSVTALLGYYIAKRIGIYETSELLDYIRWQSSKMLSLRYRKD
jgi:peptidoglycan biosynthesis protein MviN/MurJ (putative lipid II flippase)